MVSKKDDASTALVPVPVSETYLALSGTSERAAALRENLGGDRLEPSDLTRITIPTGGNVMWLVPSLDGQVPTKTIEGILLNVRGVRRYWKQSAPKGSPPDCACSDTTTNIGVGTPGGDCEKCPLNQWGTARNDDGSPGRGKECEERRILFVLTPGEILPVVIDLPPTSIASLKRFLLKLPKPYTNYVTGFGVKMEEKNNRSYSVVDPRVVHELDEVQSAGVQRYIASLGSLFCGVATSDGDAAVTAD